MYSDTQLRDSERFSQFIWTENERLNRLIQDLYLYFRLGHRTEAELYEHICQEVARYFHAGSCQLYLVTYEESTDADGKVQLTKWLELVGAFGPWRRALRQRYSRRRSRNRYKLLFGSMLPIHDDCSTRSALLSREPQLYPTTYDMPRQYAEEAATSPHLQNDKLEKDLPTQIVWHNDCLYNSCRGVLAAPLHRMEDPELSVTHPGDLRPVGLIKVENRMPWAVPGFDETSQSDSVLHQSFFRKEWEIAALRPYIRDLYAHLTQVQSDPFTPVVNDVGWQQYFDDHPAGTYYYRTLIEHLHQRRKSHRTEHNKEERDALLKAYGALDRWLRDLVEMLIRLEGWFQTAKWACQTSCGLTQPPLAEGPRSSLFNVYNVRAAFLSDQRTHPMEVLRLLADAMGEAGNRLADGSLPPPLVVFGGLLKQLVPDSQVTATVRRVVLLEMLRTATFLRPGAGSRTSDGALARIYQAFDDLLEDELVKDDSTGGFGAAGKGYCKAIIDRLRVGWRHPAGPPTFRIDAISSAVTDFALACSEKRTEIQSLTAIIEIALDREIDRAFDGRRDDVQEKMKIASFFDVGKMLTVESASATRSALIEGLTKGLDQVRRDLSGACYQPLKAADHGVSYEYRYEWDVCAALVSDVRTLFQELDESPTADGREPPVKDWPTMCRRVAVGQRTAMMSSDAFSDIDKIRVDFIASHVVQILDSHLLLQARQRDVGLEPDALQLMEMDASCIELLDTYQYFKAQARPALHYLISRAALRRRLECNVVIAKPSESPVSDLSAAIAPASLSRHQPPVGLFEGSFSYYLEEAQRRDLWLAMERPATEAKAGHSTAPFPYIGPTILGGIVQVADRRRLQVESVPADAERRTTSYTLTSLRSHDDDATPGNLAWITLESLGTSKDCDEEGARTGYWVEESIRVLLFLDPQTRHGLERYAMWQGVLLLEDVVDLFQIASAK